MATLLPPPQNAPFLDDNSRPNRAWVIFFQNLYNMAQTVLTAVTSSSLHHFASFTATGIIEDSGYSASSFAPAAGPFNGLVGNTTPAAGVFTTAQANTKFVGHNIDTNDTAALLILTNNGTAQFSIDHAAGATNILHATGANAAAPELSTRGASTDIDMKLTPKGVGKIQVNNAGSFAANGAVLTVLGGVGPTGARTTVQKWLTVKDASGNPFYIPLF